MDCILLQTRLHNLRRSGIIMNHAQSQSQSQGKIRVITNWAGVGPPPRMALCNDSAQPYSGCPATIEELVLWVGIGVGSGVGVGVGFQCVLKLGSMVGVQHSGIVIRAIIRAGSIGFGL